MVSAIGNTGSLAAPVIQSERIRILDSLRGIAILGILLMNIGGFGLPRPAVGDPSVLNEAGTINYNTWFYIELIPEGTQRALFSMLFGAGIILFISGKEKRLEGLWPADYFFRRQLWLMAFSIFDVFILLWPGDILFDYACLGMFMFAFRRLAGKYLILGAAVCFLLSLARENRDLFLEKKMIARGEAIAAIDTTRVKLTARQEEQLGAMTGFKANVTKEKKLQRMERNLRQNTSSYEELYENRTNQYLNDLVHYLYFGPWDVLLFMFLGMAFFKMGIITGQAPAKVYWLMFIVGLGIGIPISYHRLVEMINNNFNWFNYQKSIPLSLYEPSRTFRAIGIFGFIMVLYKSGLFKWLFALMRPVGQMAFTNYLTQSIICGLYFYGIGFGMMGKLERHEIYYVVGVVWVIQIIWSHIWLRYFNFGPLEWAWRSLTYWKRQPFRKTSDPFAEN